MGNEQTPERVEVTPDTDPVAVKKRFAELQAQRDSLRTRMPTAKESAKQEWEEVERYWREHEPKLITARQEVVTASKEVAAELAKVGEVIAQGYKRIVAALR